MMGSLGIAQMSGPNSGNHFFVGGRKKWQQRKGKEGEEKNVRPGVIWANLRLFGKPSAAGDGSGKKWLGQKGAGTKEKHCAGTVLELGRLHFRGDGML